MSTDKKNILKQYDVCIFGFSEKEEGGRSWMIRTGLAENGINITSCRTDADGFIAKYHDLYKKWKSLTGNIDALYVVFMGYYLMPLAWYITRRRKIPVILDAFVSQYDTEVTDRKRISRYSPRAWFLWVVDFISCFMADVIVVDTIGHKDFFKKNFFVNEKKIIVVPIGCRSDVFVPTLKSERPDDKFIIEFHGSFIPLQGIEYIMEAAQILQEKDKDIYFIIIGKGQTFDEMTRLVQKFRLLNIEFFGTIPQKDIPGYIARAHICLGIFGKTEKALRVIPNKVYECLSCGKAVITERSPAALEMLRDREEVLMVVPGNSTDLAEKILELKENSTLRIHLEKGARAISLNKFSTYETVKSLVAWIKLQS